MTRKRKDLLDEIERQKRAYYEHIRKSQEYTSPQDQEFALKTADRIKRQILRLAEQAGVNVVL